MRPNVSSRIATETSSVSNLITSIKRGEIKVPQFQRKFVWKDEQALDLLDSIANNYPIGSLLLWRTPDKLRAERNIGEFKLPVTDDLSPTDYVLDGQQRLTVIYSCLGAPESENGFSVVYDLDKELFLRAPEDRKIHHFPLRLMFQTTPLLNFRTALLTLPTPNIYQERLDVIIHSFTDYKLPIVTLKDLAVEQVCPIFERINSSGTKLSTYDLMVAATWTDTFDLNDEVNEVCEALKPKGFDDINRTTVLKCLSAVQLGTIKEKSLKTLRDSTKSELDQLITKAKNALLKSVDLLSTEFRIYSWDFLSYEALIVIVCYIYANTPILTHEQVRRMRQWFWRASFGERYKVGGENFVSNDLKKVYDFVVSNMGSVEEFGTLPTEKDWLSLQFRSNVSRSRAFILALAAKVPYDITNGARIDPAQALSVYNKKQFHHIHPRAYLRATNSLVEDNLVINICMLSAAANNLISASNPTTYLPECVANLGTSSDNVFASNLLPIPSVFDYAENSYEAFLKARVELVTSFISHLCNGGI